MVGRKFLKANKIFMQFCATWAGLNRDFGIPTGRVASLMGQLFLFWNLVIFTTSLVKFFMFQDAQFAAVQSFSKWLKGNNATRRSVYMAICKPIGLREVILLDYLPCIDEFGKLYYGLVSVCIGAALFWRIYLNYYVPHFLSRRREPSPLGCAKQRLVTFFMEGPRQESPNDIAHNCVNLDLGQRSHQSDGSSKIKYPLTRVYNKVGTVAEDDARNITWNDEPSEWDGVYTNSIRTIRVFNDTSEERWLYLAKFVYFIVGFIASVSVPILWFTVTALHAVIQNFTMPEDIADSMIGRALRIYGIFEQAYSVAQSAMFFTATNIFFSLFHGNLIHRIKPIAYDLNRLNKYYQIRAHHRKQIYANSAQLKTRSPDKFRYAEMLKLRFWSYFDELEQLDSFVSSYSVVSIVIFTIGLSFGQSFLRLSQGTLIMGTAAVLAANFISFVYLYVVSWHIEMSNDLQSTIMYIMSREDDHATKLIWQRILSAFYESDRQRGFTLFGRRTMNLHLLFKIIFALLTMSLLMNKLFHKRIWESSFQARLT